jgi:hypothetical protein
MREALPTINIELIRNLHRACAAILAETEPQELLGEIGTPNLPEEPITLESLCPPVVISKTTLLSKLKIPTQHAVRAFERQGFYTVGSILKLSRAEALSIPRMGEKSLGELLEALESHGYRLRGIPKPRCLNNNA